MLVNKKDFKIKSEITDNWGDKHRIAIDLEAISEVKNWKIALDLPQNYQIDEIYRGGLIKEDGKTYLTGAGWNRTMKPGDKNEIVLIVDEGNSQKLAPIPLDFSFADSATNSANLILLNLIQSSILIVRLRKTGMVDTN